MKTYAIFNFNDNKDSLYYGIFKSENDFLSFINSWVKGNLALCNQFEYCAEDLINVGYPHLINDDFAMVTTKLSVFKNDLLTCVSEGFDLEKAR